MSFRTTATIKPADSEELTPSVIAVNALVVSANDDELKLIKAYKQDLIYNKILIGDAIDVYCQKQRIAIDVTALKKMDDKAFKEILLAARGRLTTENFKKYQHRFNYRELAIFEKYYVEPAQNAQSTVSVSLGSGVTANAEVKQAVGLNLATQPVLVVKSKPESRPKRNKTSDNDESNESEDIFEQIKKKIETHRQDKGGYELGAGLWSGKSLKLGDNKTLQVSTGAYEVYQDILKTQSKKGGMNDINKKALLARIKTKMSSKSVAHNGLFGLGKRYQSTADLGREIAELASATKRVRY